jgi:hypothetical protein
MQGYVEWVFDSRLSLVRHAERFWMRMTACRHDGASGSGLTRPAFRGPTIRLKDLRSSHTERLASPWDHKALPCTSLVDYRVEYVGDSKHRHGQSRPRHRLYHQNIPMNGESQGIVAVSFSIQDVESPRSSPASYVCLLTRSKALKAP